MKVVFYWLNKDLLGDFFCIVMLIFFLLKKYFSYVVVNKG